MESGARRKTVLHKGRNKSFRISDKLSKNAGMPAVGICKRRPQGATGAVCTSPLSHKVTIIRFTAVCFSIWRIFVRKGIQWNISG